MEAIELSNFISAHESMIKLVEDLPEENVKWDFQEKYTTVNSLISRLDEIPTSDSVHRRDIILQIYRTGSKFHAQLSCWIFKQV